MYQGEELYLMIASSGRQGSLKKRDKNQSALDGVMYDLALFKQKFQGKCHDHIVTSQDRKTLLPKQYICNWLFNYFKQATADVYLFYTGHGHQNGDWAIQTLQEPNGDTFKFQKFLELWRNSNQLNKKNRDIHLYLFMDSCYSGNWSSKLANSTQRNSISIFTSCREDQKSTDMEGGGLLNRCLLAARPIQLQYDIQLLFNPAMKQDPQFINGDLPSALNASHIKQLAQNLKNAWSIKSSDKPSNPQKLDWKKQEELEKQKKMEEDRRRQEEKRIEQQRKKQEDERQKKQLEQQKKKKKEQEEQARRKKEEEQKKIEEERRRQEIQRIELERRKKEQPKNNIKKEEQLKDQVVKAAASNSSNGKIVNWESLKEKTTLWLDNKGLSGLPECFGELSQLKELRLHSNPLVHFPECILRLHNLTDLSIHHAGLEQLPEDFGLKLPNLEILRIQNNRLRRLPSSFGNLQKLRQLYMTVEPDSEFGLSQIPLPSNLKQLYIHLKKETSQQEKQEFEKMCKSKNIKLVWWNFETRKPM